MTDLLSDGSRMIWYIEGKKLVFWELGFPQWPDTDILSIIKTNYNFNQSLPCSQLPFGQQCFNIHNDEDWKIANSSSSFVSSPPSPWKAFRKLLGDDTVFMATLAVMFCQETCQLKHGATQMLTPKLSFELWKQKHFIYQHLFNIYAIACFDFCPSQKLNWRSVFCFWLVEVKW